MLDNDPQLTSSSSSSSSGTVDERLVKLPLPTSSPKNLDRLLEREQKALAKAYQEMARIGVNVSAEAQNLFDILSKTQVQHTSTYMRYYLVSIMYILYVYLDRLPCKWKGDKIIVLDDILISPPYKPENCSAAKNHEASLERVKKVASSCCHVYVYIESYQIHCI